jgi:hypothetical protein
MSEVLTACVCLQAREKWGIEHLTVDVATQARIARTVKSITYSGTWVAARS